MCLAFVVFWLDCYITLCCEGRLAWSGIAR